MLAPGDGDHVEEEGAGGASSDGPEELWEPSCRVLGGLVLEEIDVDVHAEDTGNDHEGAHHESCRREHDPHLEKMVLLVVQHYVDVILRVVHVLPQLHTTQSTIKR